MIETECIDAELRRRKNKSDSEPTKNQRGKRNNSETAVSQMKKKSALQILESQRNKRSDSETSVSKMKKEISSEGLVSQMEEKSYSEACEVKPLIRRNSKSSLLWNGKIKLSSKLRNEYGTLFLHPLQHRKQFPNDQWMLDLTNKKKPELLNEPNKIKALSATFIENDEQHFLLRGTLSTGERFRLTVAPDPTSNRIVATIVRAPPFRSYSKEARYLVCDPNAK
jgi:uncharacterized protein YaaR (DUF327 family)